MAAEQRQPFRFRIPWLSGPSASRVAAETQRPRPASGPVTPSPETTVARPVLPSIFIKNLELIYNKQDSWFQYF